MSIITKNTPGGRHIKDSEKQKKCQNIFSMDLTVIKHWTGKEILIQWYEKNNKINTIHFQNLAIFVKIEQWPS